MVDERLGGLVCYEPLNEKVEEFHGSPAIVRCLLGGNGSGKTEAACAEAALCLQGIGRIRGRPVHGWVWKQQFPQVHETDPILKKLVFGDKANRRLPLIGPAMYGKLDRKAHVLRLSNGSTLQYRTWRQGWEAAQGEDPDFIMIDEECPGPIWDESYMRMLRKPDGFLILSFTPVRSRAWVQRMEHKARESGSEIRVWYLDTLENKYLDQDRVGRITSQLDERERQVRVYGHSRQSMARVYGEWGADNWRGRSELPPDGTDYVVIDVGVGSACAAIWLRRTREGDLWCHREYYLIGEPSVPAHVDGIMTVNANLRVKDWYIDGWASSVSPITGARERFKVADLWRNSGLPVKLTPMTPVSYRKQRFIETSYWVQGRKGNQPHPRLYALSDLKNLDRELSEYCFKGLVVPDSTGMPDVTAESFVGPNHLIFGVEMGCVMRLPYIEQSSRIYQELAPPQAMSHRAWNMMSEISRQNLRAQGVTR